MKTFEDIYKKMVDEMPYNCPTYLKPYVKQLAEIYAKSCTGIDDNNGWIKVKSNDDFKNLTLVDRYDICYSGVPQNYIMFLDDLMDKWDRYRPENKCHVELTHFRIIREYPAPIH